MKKIFKVIFNRHLNKMVVTSELAKGVARTVSSSTNSKQTSSPTNLFKVFTFSSVFVAISMFSMPTHAVDNNLYRAANTREDANKSLM